MRSAIAAASPAEAATPLSGWREAEFREQLLEALAVFG